MATAPLAASTSRSTTSEPKQQPRTVDDDGEDEDDNNKEPDCVPRLSVDEAKEGVLRAFLEANRPVGGSHVIDTFFAACLASACLPAAPTPTNDDPTSSHHHHHHQFIIVGAASGWRATREWVAEGEADDFVTPDRLVAALGADVSVPVVESTLRAGAGGGGGGEYGEEPRREMALGKMDTRAF